MNPEIKTDPASVRDFEVDRRSNSAEEHMEGADSEGNIA